jgi:hypothetical protein
MRGQLGLGTLLPRQAARRRAGGDEPAGAVARANAAAEEAAPRAWGFSTPTRARVRGRAAEPETGRAAETHLRRAIAPRAGLGLGISSGISARSGTASRAHAVGRPGTRTGAGPSASTPRTAALRYAAWNWPITPSRDQAASTDLEQVFATWSRTPEAPILAACGVAFDVIEADAASGRTALMRLDRLGVQLGPVLATARSADPSGAPRISFLVRVGTAAALSALLDPSTGPVLLGHRDHVELPKALEQSQAHAQLQLHLQPHRGPGQAGEPFWLRAPSAARPMLPAAHVVLGALALAPRRTLAGSLGR